ncbi:MAG: alpha/beta fold hydrolase [Methanomicrobiales archaeon]
MPKITNNGIKIYYEDSGEGNPLILLHGLSDSAQIWDIIKDKFIDNYRVITMDLRGHGRSDKPDSSYSISDLSNDLNCLLNLLKIEKTNILGFSLGGAVAQQFTLDHPDKVDSLILLSSFSYIDDDFKNKLKFLRNSLKRGGCAEFYDEAVKLVLPLEFLAKYETDLAAGKEICMEMNSAPVLIGFIDAICKFNLKNRVKNIEKPTLIICGKNDIFTPLKLSVDLNNSIKNSKLEIMDQVGHNLFIPENINILSKVILNFLNNH